MDTSGAPDHGLDVHVANTHRGQRLATKIMNELHLLMDVLRRLVPVRAHDRRRTQTRDCRIFGVVRASKKSTGV